MPGPLDGLTILDLTRLLPGPAATQMLANFGADVIKVEEPGRGDYAREIPPLIRGQGALFGQVNRGKRSVAINLKDPRGADAFRRLASQADVVLEGFRPGVMPRLGLGYDSLSQDNPRLIYGSLTGYGQSGEYAQLAGHDINYLATAGVLDTVGPENGPPAIPGVQIADLAAGALPAVIGVLLAVAAREKTGRGQMVDVSMLDGSVGLLPLLMGQFAATGQTPKRGATDLTGRYACYNIYRTRDGRYISVGALELKFWAELCHALGLPQLIKDQYAEGPRRVEVIQEVGRVFKTRTAADWMALFSGKDTCTALVKDLSEVTSDPYLRGREMVVPIKDESGEVHPHLGVFPKLSHTPGALGGRPPELGEHTFEILRAAGLDGDSLDVLASEGVIAG